MSNSCSKCTLTKYWDGSSCEDIPDSFLNCTLYNPNTNLCETCEDPKYLTHGHCCAEESFYSASVGQCETITSLLFDNCKKVDDSNNCTECKDNTYYEYKPNICCLLGNWGDDCTSTGLTDCKQFNTDGTCKQCDPTKFQADVLINGNHYCQPFRFHEDDDKCVKGEFLTSVLDQDGKPIEFDYFKCTQCTDYGLKTGFYINPLAQEAF